MRISDFIQQYPYYAIDFEVQIRDQPRVFDTNVLDQLPVDLEPDHEYRAGSRGRPNLNQTLTHSQCATCLRVRRNDFFYTLPSMMKKNVVFSHCRECSQGLNSVRYETRSEVIKARREVLWLYVAPRCLACGFDKHPSAMELHHPEHKEAQLQELVTSISINLEYSRVEALFRLAARCTPLCSNCHRMLHAGAISAPSRSARPTYRIADLLDRLTAIK